MRKLFKSTLLSVLLCVLMALCSVVGIVTIADADAIPSNWNDAGATTFVANEDGSVTATSNGDAPFQQRIYTTASKLGETGNYNDFYYAFNFKMQDNGTDQPISFNYGILGGAQVNMTFYVQDVGNGKQWTNFVIGGTSFDASTVYTATSYNAGTQVATTDSATVGGIGFGQFILSLGGLDLPVAWNDTGIDLCARITADTTNNKLTVRYYKGAEIVDNALFLEFAIASEAALATNNSFFGATAFASTFTASNVSVNSVATEQAPSDEPIASNWNDAGAVSYTANNDGSVTATSDNDGGTAFNQRIYTTASKMGEQGNYSDFYYAFNLKAVDNGTDQPVSFNYGILGGAQVNMTFYVQDVGNGKQWTNFVIGGTSFDASTVYTATSYNAGTQVATTDSATAGGIGFGQFILPVADLGIPSILSESGASLCLRITKDSENNTLSVKYYLGAEVSDSALVFEFKLANAAALNTNSSFFGMNVFASTFTVSNVTIGSVSKSNNAIVAFETNGGTTYDNAVVTVGETVTKPTMPKKVGYDFDGWYTSEDEGATLSATEFDFATPITEDIVLYAKWVKNDNTTSWQDGGENIAFSPNADKSVTVTTADTGVGFGTPAMNQAAYYLASSLGSGASYDDFYYSFNLKATDNPDFPFHPVTFNYGIAGGPQVNMTFFWQLESGVRCWTNFVLGGESFTADEGGALYSATSYKVGGNGKVLGGPVTSESGILNWGTFIVGNLNQMKMKDLGVEQGHNFCIRITKDEANNKVLIRYYYDTACNAENLMFAFEIANNANALRTADSFLGITVYNTTFTLSDIAMEEVSTYTVSFNSDGGSAVESQSIVVGTKAMSPTAPEKDNYTFLGWYNGDTKWDFDNDVVTSDITLVAKWEKIGGESSGGCFGSVPYATVGVTLLCAALLVLLRKREHA